MTDNEAPKEIIRIIKILAENGKDHPFTTLACIASIASKWVDKETK